MPWEASHNVLLTGWLRDSIGHCVMHRRAGEYYQRVHKYLGVLSVLIGAVLSTTEAATLFQNTNTTSNAIRMSLALLATACASLSSYLHYEELSVEHFAASARYYATSLDIQSMLAQPVADRMDSSVYVPNMMQRLTDINARAPLLYDSLRVTCKAEIDSQLSLIDTGRFEKSLNPTELLNKTYDSVRKKRRTTREFVLFDSLPVEQHAEAEARLDLMEQQEKQQMEHLNMA